MISILVLAWGTLAAGDALETQERWNLWGSAGGSWMHDTYLSGVTVTPGGEKAVFDPGSRFDVGVGYRLTPWLELGAQSGIGCNTIQSFWDIPAYDSLLVQTPLLASLTLETDLYRKLGGIVRFAGGGVWVNALIESWAWDGGGGSSFVGAYEISGGLTYALDENHRLGLIYRYGQTESLTWDLDWWDGWTTPIGVRDLRNHSVGLESRRRF